LFGRRTRTLLPTASTLLQPKVPHDARDKLLRRKEIQSYYYNRNVKELPPLQRGETVRMHKDNKWLKAEVQDQVDIRSYKIRTEDGREYRRNRRHLRKSKTATETVSSTPDVPIPDEPNSPPPLPPPGEMISKPPAVQSDVHTQSTTTTTRSGRAVKQPKYLQDYELKS